MNKVLGAIKIIGLSLLCILSVQSVNAETTRRFNGLTREDVQEVLGKPDRSKKYLSLSEEVWYYGSLEIRFKNGKITECRIPDRPSFSFTSTSSLDNGIGSTRRISSGIPKFELSSKSPSKTTDPKEGLFDGTNRFSNSKIGRSDDLFGTRSRSKIGDRDTTSHREYLGKLSLNPYDPESISNSYGRYGSPYGNTLTNPYSKYGSKYSSSSWQNPYATKTPKIYAEDGTYLGKLSTNRYDPESISNPYGRYGNPYGNTLVNPYSRYGSPYSPLSWSNPYTRSAPRIYFEE